MLTTPMRADLHHRSPSLFSLLLAGLLMLVSSAAVQGQGEPEGGVNLQLPGGMKPAMDLIRQGRFREALAAIDDFSAREGTRWEVLVIRSDVYLRMGDNGLARRDLERAREIAPPEQRATIDKILRGRYGPATAPGAGPGVAPSSPLTPPGAAPGAASPRPEKMAEEGFKALERNMKFAGAERLAQAWRQSQGRLDWALPAIQAYLDCEEELRAANLLARVRRDPRLSEEQQKRVSTWLEQVRPVVDAALAERIAKAEERFAANDLEGGLRLLGEASGFSLEPGNVIFLIAEHLARADRLNDAIRHFDMALASGFFDRERLCKSEPFRRHATQRELANLIIASFGPKTWQRLRGDATTPVPEAAPAPESPPLPFPGDGDSDH